MVFFGFLHVQAQEACGPLEIDNALSVVRRLEKDIQDAKASADEGKLKPLPGENVSDAYTGMDQDTCAYTLVPMFLLVQTTSTRDMHQ